MLSNQYRETKKQKYWSTKQDNMAHPTSRTLKTALVAITQTKGKLHSHFTAREYSEDRHSLKRNHTQAWSGTPALLEKLLSKGWTHERRKCCHKFKDFPIKW